MASNDDAKEREGSVVSGAIRPGEDLAHHRPRFLRRARRKAASWDGFGKSPIRHRPRPIRQFAIHPRLRAFSTRHAGGSGRFRNIAHEHEGDPFIALSELGDVIEHFSSIASGVKDRDIPAIGATLLAEWLNCFTQVGRYYRDPLICRSVAGNRCDQRDEDKSEGPSHEAIVRSRPVHCNRSLRIARMRSGYCGESQRTISQIVIAPAMSRMMPDRTITGRRTNPVP